MLSMRIFSPFITS